MWYLCRVYAGERSREEWFARVPVEGDSVDVGLGECRVRYVQLRSFVTAVPPPSNEVAAIVHAEPIGV